MKSKFLRITIVIAFATFGAQAQTEKGSIGVSGISNIKISTYDSSPNRTYQLSLNARGGYFVIDNLAFGPLISIGNYKSGDYKDFSTGLGLFGRYYIKGALFFGGSISHFNSKSSSSGNKYTSKGNMAGLEAGYALFLNEHVSIEPSLNYSIYGGGNYSNSSNIGINVGISVYF